MNQTEIDELRRLHEADSAKIINAMANIDWQQHLMNAGGCFHVEDDGRLCGRADRWSGHGEPDFHMFVPLYVAATKLAKGNALPRLLAALDEARAERSEARSLLLNGIQTNGDSLAFLEHVRREHAAVVAERDALLRIINDSFLSLNNPTSTLAFDGRNLVPHVEEASRYAEILRLERDAADAKLTKVVEKFDAYLDSEDEDRVADWTALCEAVKAAKVPPDLDQLTR